MVRRDTAALADFARRRYPSCQRRELEPALFVSLRSGSIQLILSCCDALAIAPLSLPVTLSESQNPPSPRVRPSYRVRNNCVRVKRDSHMQPRMPKRKRAL